MCWSISSSVESTPEPGCGAVLKPVAAADSEFIVVRLRFPGELCVVAAESDDEPVPASNTVLNCWGQQSVRKCVENVSFRGYRNERM